MTPMQDNEPFGGMTPVVGMTPHPGMTGGYSVYNTPGGFDGAFTPGPGGV